MSRSHPRQVVLVVDDDRDLCRLVNRLLEPLGYCVHEASTAIRALSVAEQERPAAVLLDVHLPDMSGYEVCRRLRDSFGNDIAIVFLSGERTEEFDRTAGMLLGADDYIVKPVTMDRLAAALAKCRPLAAAIRSEAETAPPVGKQKIAAGTALDRGVLDQLHEDLGGTGLGASWIRPHPFSRRCVTQRHEPMPRASGGPRICLRVQVQCWELTNSRSNARRSSASARMALSLMPSRVIAVDASYQIIEAALKAEIGEASTIASSGGG